MEVNYFKTTYMDLFRQILPQLLGGVGTLIALAFLSFLIKKGCESDQQRKDVSTVFKYIYIIAIALFIFWIIRIASINEVPRSVIDRTAPEQMKNDFEKRVEQDASKPKQQTQTDSTNSNSTTQTK